MRQIKLPSKDDIRNGGQLGDSSDDQIQISAHSFAQARQVDSAGRTVVGHRLFPLDCEMQFRAIASPPFPLIILGSNAHSQKCVENLLFCTKWPCTSAGAVSNIIGGVGGCAANTLQLIKGRLRFVVLNFAHQPSKLFICVRLCRKREGKIREG